MVVPYWRHTYRVCECDSIVCFTCTIIFCFNLFPWNSFYLPSSPSTWTILTAEERILAVSRLEHEDNKHTHMTLADLDASNKKQAVKALTDWKVWMYMLMFFCGSVPNTSVSKYYFSFSILYFWPLHIYIYSFLPSIVRGMGYDDKLSANLMSGNTYASFIIQKRA